MDSHNGVTSKLLVGRNHLNMAADKVSVFYIGDEDVIVLPFSRQKCWSRFSIGVYGSKTVFLLLLFGAPTSFVSRTCNATFPCVGLANLAVRHSSSVSNSLRIDNRRYGLF